MEGPGTFPRDPITFWECQWNLKTMLRRWLDTPIISWEGDWIPRDLVDFYGELVGWLSNARRKVPVMCWLRPNSLKLGCREITVFFLKCFLSLRKHQKNTSQKMIDWLIIRYFFGHKICYVFFNETFLGSDLVVFLIGKWSPWWICFYRFCWDGILCFFFRGWNPNFYELDNFRQIPCPRLPNTEAEEVWPQNLPPKRPLTWAGMTGRLGHIFHLLVLQIGHFYNLWTGVFIFPIPSMYGIFTYIWSFLMVSKIW